VAGLIDRVLLRPLPLVEPSQLVAVGLEQSGGRTTITSQEYCAVETIDGIATPIVGVLPKMYRYSSRAGCRQDARRKCRQWLRCARNERAMESDSTNGTLKSCRS
jgi:hypothetical protein